MGGACISLSRMGLYVAILMLSCWFIPLICSYGNYGDEQNATYSNLYTVWSHTYPSIIIKPYDWSYLRVELPPRFASLTFTLDTDVEPQLESKSRSNVYRLPLMCFREGGPPLPDISEASMKDLVLDQVHSALIMQKCFVLQGKINFTLTNDQIAEGVLYIGLFNGIGAVRTQSKMINRGPSYTFSALASVKACKNTGFWGQYCNKPLYQLPCDQVRHQDSKTFSCKNSSGSCHADISTKLFFLNVEMLSEELILTTKSLRLDDNKRSGTQLSLMCYARLGATPTENLFDYSIDIHENPLRIKSPSLGTWYFYIVPVRHHRVSGRTPRISNLCYSLTWEVLGCPRGRFGPNCSLEGYSYIAKKFPWSNIPLESIKSKPFQGESLDHAWTYFVMKVPPHATARNMRVELTSNKSIAYEIYARLGGLPYLDVWDYYYANQTSNSNNGSLFKLYDSRDQRVKFEIVYAREGNWTIGLRHPITLINSGSQTTLSISLESCLVQCSDYGTCQDASGLKACSYCQCDGFHGGFDCSVELVSKAEQHLQMFFLVGSNAAAILPAIVALWQKSYAEGVVFLFSGVASAIYHACDLESMCLLKYSVLQFLDFWLSFVAVISIFVYMATISEAAKRTILSIVWILTALMSIGDATSSNNITFVLVIGALSLAVGLLIELSTKYKSVATIFHRPRSISSSWLLELVKKLNRRIRWVFVILGFIALAMAATSWNFENIQNYWICHSIWHISIYTVAFFFICSKVNVDDGFQVVPTQTSDNILA